MREPPMEFHLYPKLPLELRLKIIEEAVATRRHKADLAPWAGSINSDWNRVVERIVFKSITIDPENIQEFGRICSKQQRPELLRKLLLVFKFGPPYIVAMFIQAHSEWPDHHQEIVDGVSQLFHLMKDWSPAESPSHLLSLSISIFTDPNQHTKAVHSDSCDFKNLPKVPAIGKLHIRWSHLFSWSHRSAYALQKKLPNIHSAQLALPNCSNLQHAITRARIRITSSNAVNPHLTTLSITQDRGLGLFLPPWYSRSKRMHITESVTPQLSLWRSTLVCLRLNCHIDPPQFLLAASASLWPSLYSLELVGTLDDGDYSRAKSWDSDLQAHGDFLRGLSACLLNNGNEMGFKRSMPNLTRVSIRFLHGWKRSIFVDLDTKANADKLVRQQNCFHESHPTKGAIIPCHPVAADTAIVKAYGITLPGSLVTELQHTVRQVRRRDLAVFRCSDTIGSYRPPCAQWNSKTYSWEHEFFNDMDDFIYHMGEFWRLINAI